MDSSNVGTGCILIQQFPEGKGIISFNSRVFDKAEQKMSTLHRELCGIVSALQTYEHYIIGSPFPIYLYCDHKPILYLWGRKGQLSHRFFRYPVIITKFQNLKIIWKPGSNLAFPDILSRNVTVEEYQMHQLKHKRIPRDIEFFYEHGTPVTYQIQHEDNPSYTCNDFYPIKYKRGNEEKILRLQNDGEDFTVSSMLDEFPIISVQQASDCFRMGRFINQFRRICGPETQSNASVHTSSTEYSSIDSLIPPEDDAADPTSPSDDPHHISTEDEEDNIVCDIKIQADQGRLCQAKQAHDLVLGRTDAPLARKCLMASDAPHLNTKALIQKLDEVAKTVDLDVSTILEEQMKDPVLGTVRSWVRYNALPPPPPIVNHQKYNSLKVFYDIAKNTTDFLLKKKDSFSVITNHQTSWKRRIFVFAFLYLYCLPASNWDTTTKWEDTWEQQKPMLMPRDSTIGLECLIGYVL